MRLYFYFIKKILIIFPDKLHLDSGFNGHIGSMQDKLFNCVY